MTVKRSRPFKFLAAILCLSTFIVGAVPVRSLAYFVESDGFGLAAATTARAVDMATIQRTIETKAVSERLKGFGLTSEAVSARIEALTDEELHEFALQVDELAPGGSATGAIVGILLIVLLIFLILHLTDHKIVIK